MVLNHEEKQRVFKIIADTVDLSVNDIDDTDRLVEDLGYDCLDTVELVMELENEFDIRITDTLAESLTTVQEVLDALDNILK